MLDDDILKDGGYFVSIVMKLTRLDVDHRTSSVLDIAGTGSEDPRIIGFFLKREANV